MAALLSTGDIGADVAGRVSPSVLAMMVAGANAAAHRVAPCLKDEPTPDQIAEAKLTLLSAVTRWITDGPGMSGSSEAAGPMSRSVTPPPQRASGYRLWPSEIGDLQAICKSGAGLTSIELVSSQGPRRHARDDFDAGPPS